jgi:hypothetical protein
MRKTLIAIAAAATVAGPAITSPAQAWCFWGCDSGVGAPAAGPPALMTGAAQPYGAYYGYGPAILLCARADLLRPQSGVLLAQSTILGR